MFCERRKEREASPVRKVRKERKRRTEKSKERERRKEKGVPTRAVRFVPGQVEQVTPIG